MNLKEVVDAYVRVQIVENKYTEFTHQLSARTGIYSYIIEACNSVLTDEQKEKEFGWIPKYLKEHDNESAK